MNMIKDLELREILEALDETCCCSYHDEMCKKAKDYIINIQNEVDELNEKIDDLQEQLEYCNNWREEYRTRIDNAIEQLEHFLFKYVCDDNTVDEMNHLLDILKGEDK